MIISAPEEMCCPHGRIEALGERCGLCFAIKTNPFILLFRFLFWVFRKITRLK